MVSFTLVSAAAILAATTINAAPVESATGPATKFTMSTIVSEGESKYTGLFLSLYHVGAAENAIVGTRNTTLKTTFKLGNPNKSISEGNTMLHAIGGSKVGNETLFDYVDLTELRPITLKKDGTTKPAAPVGYNTVRANQGKAGTNGFTVHSDTATGSGESGVLTFTGNPEGSFKDFASFAICHVKRALDGNSGKELLWRSNSVEADTSGRCEDASLYTTPA